MTARQDRVRTGASVSTWPVLLLAAPAGVAIWSGWVGLGELAGFGVVRPLPGIWDDLQLNTAITLPIGMECYAAYALRVWLSGAVDTARTFARLSAIGALVLGALGQDAYHLMAAAGVTAAPWPVTALVACLPVGVLGMGAALAHLVRAERRDRNEAEQRELVDATRAGEREVDEQSQRELVTILAAHHTLTAAVSRAPRRHTTAPHQPAGENRTTRTSPPSEGSTGDVAGAVRWAVGELAAGRTAGWRRIADKRGLSEHHAKKAARAATEQHGTPVLHAVRKEA